MNLQPYYTLLQNGLSSGENIFMYHMPETVTRAVLVLHHLSGAKLYPEIPHYKRAKFQTIIREVSFQNGYDLAMQVLNVLTVSELTVGTVHLHFVNPLHDPVAFPKSAGDFIEFSVNFESVYAE